MKCALNSCNKQARRKFCCNKHKDRYHNLTNPRGRFAHLAYSPTKGKEFDPHDESDAGQWEDWSDNHD